MACGNPEPRGSACWCGLCVECRPVPIGVSAASGAASK
jgi:hypothetical protein